MATQVGSLFYDLKLDDTGFNQGLNNVDNKLKTFSSKMGAIGTKMTDVGKKATMGITLPIVGAFGFAVKSASDLNETLNKTDVAFGTSADKVKEWSKTSISSMGLAQQSALDATALFGDMSTSMGINQSKASEMSMGLTQLGADLASFKNISFDRAQTALAGVYTGETEALKGLGIVMTQTNLASFAQQKGITKSMDEMSQAELVSLRYAYVMDKTKNAQGDFARTADGTANRTRIMQEQFKETSATLGQNLLPIANKVMEWVTKMTQKFSALSPEQQKMVLIIGAIIAVIPPLLIGLGMLVTAIGAISGALAFLGANPIVLVIMAIILVIAGLAFLIIKNWDTLKRWFGTFVSAVAGFFTAMWSGIKSIFNAGKAWVKENWWLILGILTGGVGLMVAVVVKNWDKIVAGIRNGINWAKNTVSDGINGIVNFFSRLPSRIAGAIGNMGKLLYNKGRDLIDGLLNGAGSLLSKIGSFFLDKIPNWIKSPFKKALGISSPSKVFAEYGKNTMQGLVQGITRNSGKVESALAGVGNNMDLQLNSTGINGGSGASMAQNANGSPISVTIAPQGIMARSTSELRDITKEMLATVDQELRAKGKPTIMGN